MVNDCFKEKNIGEKNQDKDIEKKKTKNDNVKQGTRWVTTEAEKGRMADPGGCRSRGGREGGCRPRPATGGESGQKQGAASF